MILPPAASCLEFLGRARRIGLGAAIALHAIPAIGMAQSLPTPSTDSLFAWPSGIRVTVGALAVAQPRYEGSGRYYVSALPIFEIGASGGGRSRGDGPFEARAVDDLSLALIRHNGLEIGPLIGYRIGRDESDSPRLAGLGTIDGGLVAGGFVKYNFGPAFARVSVHQHVTGTDTGLVARLAFGARRALLPDLVLKAEVNAEFADDSYMHAYFGVSPAQAARSGLAAHEAGAGLKSVGATLAAQYALTEHWTLLASTSYARLLGDAASSPIVETTDRIEARLGAKRTFEWQLR